MTTVRDFTAEQTWAQTRDADDPLATLRGEFLIPPHGDSVQTYLCGNSLGLQPRATRQALIDELDDWAGLGVEAHFRGKPLFKGLRHQQLKMGQTLLH